MRLELAKYFHDVQRAARTLSGFVNGKSWADYERDAMLRAAVERQFEIIGEALAQLAKRDPTLAGRIREYRQIIAFRNILIHGSDPSRHEKAAAIVILIALFVLTAWLDPV